LIPATHFRHQVQREAGIKVDAAKTYMRPGRGHAGREVVGKEEEGEVQTGLKHPEPWTGGDGGQS
jgi:hypothetical protein